MTKKEYIKMQAKRFGITVAEFKIMMKRDGLKVVDCKCGHICCTGKNLE